MVGLYILVQMSLIEEEIKQIQNDLASTVDFVEVVACHQALVTVKVL